MNNMDSRKFKRSQIAMAVAFAIAAPQAINLAHAGAGWGDNANLIDKVQTYHANSPSGLRTSCFDATGAAAVAVPGGLCDSGTALRKFVDTLPGLTAAGANNLGQYLPLGTAEKWVNGQGVTTNDDYYEIAAVEHFEQMHSDLPVRGTHLRGYVQIETPTFAASHPGVSKHIPLTYPDGTPILDAKGVQVFAVDKPHYLGPIILAVQGTAVRFKFYNYLPLEANQKFYLPVDRTLQSAGVGPDGVSPYTENRTAVHMHGGDAPWVSDGTAHQWFAPAGELAAYAAGLGKGASAGNVPDMPDPGPGAYTMYYPNEMSARLMWYHEHASGLTKINAYAGLAAGYLVVDPVEIAMVAAGTLPALVSERIPLVIQDKTYVPKDVVQQDARWDLTQWGQYGDLWFTHVYETNQDPNSIDGTNPVGRWDWGPWFWPVFPAQYSLPTGANGDVASTPEAFMDTMVVNGTAYPTLTVEPKAYRMNILNGTNDRFLNLGFYLADTTSPEALAIQAATGVLGTEVTMVPFEPAARPPGAVPFPSTGGLQGTGWGTPDANMRPSGVPEPANVGPDIVRIGTEGGFLPEAVIIPSTPMNFEYNKRSVTVLGMFEHGLLLGGAERADIVVDFTAFAGKTLILYNDAPAPAPAGDPRLDYYTNGPDNSGAGGAETTLPGYGPNSRTVMRFVVAPAVTTPSNFKGIPALVQALPAAYAATQAPPIIPQVPYNTAFGTTDTNTYMKISAGAATQSVLDFTPTGPQTITSVTLVGGGTGYTTMPTVVFVPPPGGSGSGAAAVVGTGIGGLIMSNLGTGYLTPPTALFSGGTMPDGTPVDWLLNPGYAVATVTLNPLTKKIANVTFPVPGSFSTPPTITFVGGGATVPATAKVKLSGKLNSLTLTNPGTGYTAVPFVKFVGGMGIGATAAVKTNLTTSLPIRNKGIQELFDPIYGRMNATFSIEMPFTNAMTQTTLPVNYIDPNSENLKDGEINIWKITHNGVDAHPVHFHLVNVQVINRVGWDGTIKPPYADEVGWKETVRMNPLEDIYVAVKAKTPKTPGWGVPESIRARDPSQPLGSTLGFTQADFFGSPVPGEPNYNPNYGKMAPAGTVFNAMENFDNEYTWHCHILGHEEFDFMRPIAFHPFAQDLVVGSPTLGSWFVPGTTTLAIPAAPLSVIATIGAGGTTVSWIDNSTTEYQFRVERAPESAPGSGVPGLFAALGTTLANANSFVDTTALAGTVYFYRVASVGAKGESISAFSGMFLAVPGMPVATMVTGSSLRLSWNAVSGATDYRVFMNGLELPAIAGPVTTRDVTGLNPGSTYTFTVMSSNALGSSAASAPLTLSALPPAVGGLLVSAVTSTTLMLNWNAALGATGYTVYQNGVALPAVAGSTASRLITGLTPATAYSYTVAATNPAGVAPQSVAAIVTTMLPMPAMPTATLVTGTTLTLNWVAVPGATSYTVYQNGAALPAVANAAVTRAISGLTPGIPYTFTVSANKGVSSSTPSPALVVTTTPSATVPALPRATAITNTGFTLNWNAMPGATGYTVYQNGVALPAVAGVAVTRAITGLAAGATYTYTVAFTNAAGVLSPQSAPLTVVALGAPTVTLKTDVGLTLNWAAVAGATAYTVYQDGVPLPAVAGVAVSRAITGLTPDTTYSYTVSATVGGVATALSSPTLATTTLSAPTGVTFSAVTSTGVTLGWTAMPGATGYNVYANGVLMPLVTGASATAATRVITGLLSGTVYSIRVTAINAGGSSPISLSLAITTLIGAPAVPVISLVTGSSLTLSWNAVTAATGYTVYQNGVALPPVLGTALTRDITGLTPGATYNYTVAATRGVEKSQPSPATTATTLALVPVPVGLNATAVTGTSLTLNWNASPGALGYTVYQDGVALPAVAGTATSRAITGLTVGKSYSFTVSSVGPAGNSALSARLAVLALGTPVASAITTTSLMLNWAAVPGAVEYTIYQDGIAVGGTIGNAATSLAVTGLTAGRTYTYTVAYGNAAGLSPQSSGTVVTTVFGAPAAPVPSVVTSTGLTLSWPAYPGTTGYAVWKNGAVLTAALTGLTTNVTGLAPGSINSFSIAATNAAGVTSQSTAITVITPPAVPAAPVASLINNAGLTLSWPAAAGATGYTVYQNGVALPPLPGTTRTLSGLTGSTTYTFTVAASSNGISSAQSPVLSVTTSASPLQVGAVGANSVVLSWPAIAGATSVLVYKNGILLPVLPGNASSTTISGLTPLTAYSFRLSFKDAAGVFSTPSAAVAVTTTAAAPLLAAPLAGAITSSGVTLSWPAVAGATAMVVYTNGVMGAALPATAVSQVVTGLTGGTLYNFRIAYKNAAGIWSAPSAPSAVTTLPGVVAAAAPVASALTATGVTLTWAAVPGATGYAVYKNGVLMPVVAGVAVTRPVTGLVSKTTYNFRVISKNAAGVWSAPSAALTVVTP